MRLVLHKFGHPNNNRVRESFLQVIDSSR
jgi:hypothetical protein